MIISPPFLPVRAANQTETAWLETAFGLPRILPSTNAPEGSFPLGNDLAWHNGLHIQGQANTEGHTVVRAIADGEVIFVSPPQRSDTDANNPLNYNPFGEGLSWTDNGCIIVKHSTEIGAQGEQATEVVYYSVCMHLNWIGRTTPAGQTAARLLQRGDRVWRKDEIGRAGQVYGHARQVHLEITLDEANLTRLIGRASAWVDPANIPAPTADGRTDAVFGAIWFYLPANTPTLASTPTQHLRTQSQTTLGSELWVKMSYESGACTFTSYNNQGEQQGGPQPESSGEYNLYNTANTRHNALQPADRVHSSPSGWYELLRFGRNLGRGPNVGDKDLLPANAVHWRQIRGPNGQVVWADLNAEGSFKFSDADFLPIQGWCFIDDDGSPNDQHCDSNNLRNLIADPDQNATGRLEAATLIRRIGDRAVMQKLKRVVCRFPSEWDQTTIAARYSFVRELEPFQNNPEAWNAFEAHQRAISFANLPAEYTGATWRFHPKEFVEVMRTCGWLSKRELLQLVPSHSIRRNNNSNLWELIPSAQNAAIPTTLLPSLNRTLRKYGIDTPMRQAGFFGNVVQETNWMRALAEGGPSGYWYWPWFGRGLLQLTHPDNYIGYWRWRGRFVPASLENALIAAKNQAHATHSNTPLHDSNFQALTPEMINWRDAVAGAADPQPNPDNKIAPTDSAGYYWAKLGMARYADDPATQTLERFPVQTNQGAKVYYRSQGFWKVSASVNLPGAVGNTNYQGINGFDSRCCAYGVATAVLTERMLPNAQGQNVLLYPEGYTRRTP